MANQDALNHIQRYLSQYGEPESRIAPTPDHSFSHVVIIPCYDESVDCLETVFGRIDAAHDHKDGLLAIVVVNAPEDAPPEPLARTRLLWESLAGNGQSPRQTQSVGKRSSVSSETVAGTGQSPRSRSDQGNRSPRQSPTGGGESASHNTNTGAGQFGWTRTTNGVDVLAIDRVTPNRLIPRRQGVGLARKIGADIACALIDNGAIRVPWLHFADADVRLPRDYLRHASMAAGCLLFPYRHGAAENSADKELAARADTYELHLRYYVNRLRCAGSPYAFHTIGSTLAIHAEVYAKVRGVPKRNAAEDFHLLNKAAKVAPVYAVAEPEILIRARYSNRVPFGTGPALRAMSNAATFSSYASESFALLREAIGLIETGANVSLRTRNLLEELGFYQHLESARGRHRFPHTLRKALHQWFDALRTLRFIHLARCHHPDRPLLPMLDELFGKADHLNCFRRTDSERSRVVGVR